MKILIDIPDEAAEGEDVLWRTTVATLELVEPGSSKHALRRIWEIEDELPCPTGYQHARLDVTVKVVP